MTPKVRAIVVGVESVHEPDPVLRPAIELAERLRATLYVVHGYVLTDPLLDAYARAGYLGENTILNFGQDLQSALEEQVEAITSRPWVQVRAVAGPPVSAVLEVATEVGADLLVVGASRHGTFPLSLLGSTVRTLLRRAPVPVLMMRPEVPVVPRKVLAPTDLSPLSATAYGWAMTLAGAAEGTPSVRLLLVINKSLLQLPLEQRLLDDVAQKELADFKSSASVADEVVDHVVRKGDPAGEIIAEAEGWGADLVVLGTHGRKGMDRLLLGSVAEAAVRGAPCNVLVVPPVHGSDGEEPSG
jgi:nucleotide-binding universal stress UspA family protein